MTLRNSLHPLTIATLLDIVFTIGSNRVYVFKGTSDDIIYLNCSVCNLVHDVTLYTPSNYPVTPTSSYYATCLADAQYEGTRQCEDQRVTQDFSSHTTSFVIGNTLNFDKYGIWTCKHGSDLGYIKIESPEYNCDKGDTDRLWIGCQILLIVTILSVFFNVYCIITAKKKGKINKVYHRITTKIDIPEETESLIKHVGIIETDSDTCHNCKHFWPQNRCLNCKNEYCDICFPAHNKFYPQHNVFQKLSESDMICKTCNRQRSTFGCHTCKLTFCNLCANRHVHIQHNNEQTTRRRCDSVHDCVEFIKQITIPQDKDTPIRICGIAFLSDSRIVVVDNTTYTAKVFKDDKVQFTSDLKDEPRAVTGMTKNTIAISFGYKMLIKVFEIKENLFQLKKSISLRAFKLGKLKPFSVAFDENHFVIEAGEGDDGLLLIIDVEGNLKHRIFNNNDFAFFTGNTIRLALNMCKKRVYISGISKKAVSCINFDGHIVWNVPISCPRSLVYIPGISDYDIILCASKRSNGIFRLRDEDGKYDIINSECTEGKITGSRYISYHSENQLLCVQVSVKNDTDESVEKLNIYKYNDTY